MATEMPNEAGQSNPLFLGLVQQHQLMALIHLGKMVHPESQKTERNLEAAKVSIDLLGMLEEKTKGNLSHEEDQFLKQVSTNLRLNFVDEAQNKGGTDQDEQKEEAGDTEESGGSGDASP